MNKAIVVDPTAPRAITSGNEQAQNGEENNHRETAVELASVSVTSKPRATAIHGDPRRQNPSLLLDYG